jgi:hypothetical protein
MAAAILILAVIVVPLPGWIVAVDLGSSQVAAAEQLRAVNNVRTALLSALAGLAVGVGAYATWRRVRINEEELRTSRDGQITERYSRAVEHLGSTSTDVRMGGVYALERLARNSPEDRDSVVAVLCAYVRGHAPWPPTLPDQAPADAVEVPSLAIRAADVHAALIVLGRVRDGRHIGLPHTDLRYARVTDLDFAGANFDSAAMRRIRMRGCDLRGTSFLATDLRDADLRGADLREADLRGTRFAGARADATTRWPEGFDSATAGIGS